MGRVGEAVGDSETTGALVLGLKVDGNAVWGAVGVVGTLVVGAGVAQVASDKHMLFRAQLLGSGKTHTPIIEQPKYKQ